MLELGSRRSPLGSKALLGCRTAPTTPIHWRDLCWTRLRRPVSNTFTQDTTVEQRASDYYAQWSTHLGCIWLHSCYLCHHWKHTPSASGPTIDGQDAQQLSWVGCHKVVNIDLTSKLPRVKGKPTHFSPNIFSHKIGGHAHFNGYPFFHHFLV